MWLFRVLMIVGAAVIAGSPTIAINRVAISPPTYDDPAQGEDGVGIPLGVPVVATCPGNVGTAGTFTIESACAEVDAGTHNFVCELSPTTEADAHVCTTGTGGYNAFEFHRIKVMTMSWCSGATDPQCEDDGLITTGSLHNYLCHKASGDDSCGDHDDPVPLWSKDLANGEPIAHPSCEQIPATNARWHANGFLASLSQAFAPCWTDLAVGWFRAGGRW